MNFWNSETRLFTDEKKPEQAPVLVALRRASQVQPASFCFNNSVTWAGFALPFDAFMV